MTLLFQHGGSSHITDLYLPSRQDRRVWECWTSEVVLTASVVTRQVVSTFLWPASFHFMEKKLKILSILSLVSFCLSLIFVYDISCSTTH